MSLHNNVNHANITQTSGVRHDVWSAIKSASQKTGVSFDYLLDQARVESNFRPDIKAKTSSATGLYQFINTTWMGMVEKYGEKYGIDTQAKSKKEILDLRKDPKMASYMAAEFAKENSNHLQNTVGGEIGETDLYLAHFLGAGGAEKFLKGWKDNPNQAADQLFPAAAKANKNVFYDRQTGKTRTLDDVYQFFANKFDANTTYQTAVAQTQAPRAIEPKGEEVLASPLRVTQPYNRGSLMRLVPKQEVPILSPYTNMILAALEVPRGTNKGEGTVWFNKGNSSQGQNFNSLL